MNSLLTALSESECEIFFWIYVPFGLFREISTYFHWHKSLRNMKNDDIIDIDDHSDLNYPSSSDGDVDYYTNGHETLCVGDWETSGQRFGGSVAKNCEATSDIISFFGMYSLEKFSHFQANPKAL